MAKGLEPGLGGSRLPTSSTLGRRALRSAVGAAALVEEADAVAASEGGWGSVLVEGLAALPDGSHRSAPDSE